MHTPRIHENGIERWRWDRGRALCYQDCDLRRLLTETQIGGHRSSASAQLTARTVLVTPVAYP